MFVGYGYSPLFDCGAHRKFPVSINKQSYLVHQAAWLGCFFRRLEEGHVMDMFFLKVPIVFCVNMLQHSESRWRNRNSQTGGEKVRGHDKPMTWVKNAIDPFQVVLMLLSSSNRNFLSMVLPTYPGKIPQTSPNPTKKKNPSETVGEGSWVSSRGMWVRS